MHAVEAGRAAVWNESRSATPSCMLGLELVDDEYEVTAAPSSADVNNQAEINNFDFEQDAAP